MSLMKRKLQDEILGRMGYVMVPSELFQALRGDPSELVVWAYLFNQSEGWHPSFTQIADAIGMSDRQVMRIVASLVEKGFLIKHVNPLGGKNTYEFTEISSWNLKRQDGKVNDNKASDILSQAVTKTAPFLEESIPFKENLAVTSRATFSAPPDRNPVAPMDTQKNHKEAPPSNPEASTHGNMKATPSIDEIRLDWESRNNIAVESPSFNTRLVMLQELMATYKSHGYSIDDVNSRSNRTRILEHYYKRIKKKSSKDAAERSSLEDWEAALGLLVEGTVRVAQAPRKPSNHHIAAFEDKKVDPENQLSEEEIDRMLDE